MKAAGSNSPQRLKIPSPGKEARLRIVSPSSYPQPDRLDAGVQALRALGFEVSIARHALDQFNGCFAGTVEARLEDLHSSFLDPAVDAILCSRGGYGSNYLLGRINEGIVRANPKPLLGYSDLTAIQTWLLDEAGLPAFHAPMAAVDFAVRDGVELKSLMAALGGRCWELGGDEGLRILRPGGAVGTLYGGCLAILAASMGTPYEPQTEGRLLFLEDQNVKLYQFDRLLRQMLLGGKFNGVVGIIFGEMCGCLEEGQTSADLDAVILRVLDFFDGPIAAGLRSGHVSRSNATLVFGLPAKLDLTGDARLEFLEPATIPGIR